MLNAALVAFGLIAGQPTARKRDGIVYVEKIAAMLGRRGLRLVTYYALVQLVAGVNAVLVVFHYNFGVYRQRTVFGGVRIHSLIVTDYFNIRYSVRT